MELEKLIVPKKSSLSGGGLDGSGSGNGADGCMGEGKTLQVPPKRSKRKVRGRRRSQGSDGRDLGHGTGSENTLSEVLTGSQTNTQEIDLSMDIFKE